MMWSHGFKQMYMPLTLEKCHMPLAHRIVTCPWHFWMFSLLCTLWAEFTKLQILLGSLGVSEATSLFIRCCSPPGMSFLLRKLASHHHSAWEHTRSFTTDLNVPHWQLGQSPLLHIQMQFVLVVHMDRVTALCYLKLGSQAPGKGHSFVHCFSARKINFHMTLEVGHRASHTLPADSDAGW